MNAFSWRALAALGVAALAACSGAEAAAPPPPAAYEPHPSMAIVDRLASSSGLPALEGMAADEAVAALSQAGLSAVVVAHGEGPVSAQYPEPGAAAPADGQVVLWVGVPAPPPPPPPPPPPDEGKDDAASDDEQPEGPTQQPAAARSPAASPPAQSAPAPSPPAQSAPAPSPPTPSGPDAPHPPRTNPRRLPASEPGTTLDGLASWYGDKFAGRTTACGAVFDPGELTLATRELQCGARVRITGPSGATVEAVATDWGPAEWTGRRFDLSRATFEAIHPLSAGVITVTVEVLP